MKEFIRIHRPKSFEEVVGQPQAVKVLKSFLKNGTLPHFLLFSGPSGTGKTTLARIIRRKLNCGNADFMEINAASARGIDMVRGIESKMGLAPLSGDVKIYLIDEAHMLTGDAQNSFLKALEDTPEHVYFIFATTNKEKLIQTIKTRATEIRLREVEQSQIEVLLETVAKKEGIKLTKEISDRICECSMGSPRAALVILNKIKAVEPDERLEAVESVAENPEAIQLARALLNPKITFKELAPIIKSVSEDAESIRWMVLAYMSNVVLGGGYLAPRAIQVMRSFQYDYFNTKKAGLILSCADLAASR